MSNLQQLQDAVATSFRWSTPQPANWVPEQAGVDHDVVIVGGGQTGVAIAYGLRRQGINNVLVIDQSAPGGAGIWGNVARMNLLRTSKFLPGPDFGNPNLSFRSWYETQFGSAAFDVLDRIRREDWASYLQWYQQTVEVGVQYQTRLLSITQAEHGYLQLHLERNGQAYTLVSRKLILATGFMGAGEDNIPAIFKALPKQVWAHTSEPIAAATLKNRRIGILGAGPSAFDVAGYALEQGAAAVHLFSRRSGIVHQPNSQPGVVPPAGPSPVPAPQKPPSGRNYPGAMDNFHLLPDEVRWRYHLLSKGAAASTPEDSIKRATDFPNFHLHLNASWDRAVVADNQVVVQGAGESFRFDYVLAGTGLRIDLSARPELSAVIGDVALWGDRYQAAPGEEYPAATIFPYLGDSFEFLEKVPGTAPYISNIYCYNWAAALSSGKNLSDIPSIPELGRLISGVSRSLFLQDLQHHSARITGSGPERTDPSLYAEAVWPLRRTWS